MIGALPSPDSLTLFAACVGLGVFAIVVGLYSVFAPRPVEQRLAQFVSVGPTSQRQNLDAVRTGGPVVIAALDRRLARRAQSAGTRLLLQRANVSMTFAELLLLQIGCALAAGGLVGVLVIPLAGVAGVPVAVVLALGGSYMPRLYVGVRARRRIAALEGQLPDAIDMVTAVLQSGSGITQALGIVAREMPPPISDEVRRVLREMEIGLSLNEALSNLVTRLGSADFDLVVTTINVQARVGGNLVSILRTINHTIRERVRFRGEVRVLTSMQRMSAMVIGGIPPTLGVGMFLANPAYMGRLLEPGLGQTMLVTSAAMSALGILVLRRLTDIEI